MSYLLDFHVLRIWDVQSRLPVKIDNGFPGKEKKKKIRKSIIVISDATYLVSFLFLNFSKRDRQYRSFINRSKLLIYYKNSILL